MRELDIADRRGVFQFLQPAAAAQVQPTEMAQPQPDHAAAQNAGDHLADACLGDIKDLLGIGDVDRAEGDDGGNKQGEQPRGVQAMATEAASPVRPPRIRPMILLMMPPTVGKLTTAAEVNAQ